MPAAADRGSAWLYFPDYRGSNPYQALLAASLPQGLARPGTIEDALEAAPGTVFHLHWEDAVYRAATTTAEADALALAFVAQCAALHQAGGRIVWTMHNAAPHENRFPATDLALRRELAALADCVHVHGPTGATLAAGLGVPTARILIEPHFALHPAYPDDISDAAARRYLDLAPDTTVFAFLGAMRAYKGVQALADAFAPLHARRPDTALLLAGQGGRAPSCRYTMPAPGLRLLPRFIADAEVQYVLRAADFVVLPYSAILTSGALVLACGFGRPVIAPDHPGLRDMLGDAPAGLLDPAGGLPAALEAACAMPDAQRAAMRAAALPVGHRPVSCLAAALLQRLGWDDRGPGSPARIPCPIPRTA